VKGFVMVEGSERDVDGIVVAAWGRVRPTEGVVTFEVADPGGRAGTSVPA
jgi:hypothetical protein